MRILLIALPALLLLSCGTDRVILRPEGSSAALSLIDGNVREVELLALQDSVLFCLTDTLLELPVARVQSLRLKIDESRGWFLPVAFLQALPTGILLAVEKEARPAGEIWLGITALTWAAFEFSGPRVDFEQPWGKKDIEALRLHLRYPQSLTDEQITNLRTSFTKK